MNRNIRCTSENVIAEVIVLAGGLGTRLQPVVSDLPKCMAEVDGRPFLYYVINNLRMQGIEKISFSLGYKHEIILEWLLNNFPTLNYNYVVEKEPLGTGGAIRLALQKTNSENIFITNGDTLFKFDAGKLYEQHLKIHADCTLALKPMHHFNRYGVVELDNRGLVVSFKEKQQYEEGCINAGVYLLNKASFSDKDFPEKFSFEQHYLEKYAGTDVFAGTVIDNYFIDIGIPEDYARAQKELAKTALDLSQINKEWTLFLDRDGVINEDYPGHYITRADDFIFSEGVPQLFKTLTEKFKKIIVVTNQRGVGRGIIPFEELTAMNVKMLKQIEAAGGRIDSIYFCTDTDDKAFNRKPNPGMALRALKDFPEIDITRSIMVGNRVSDMKFGRYAGMHTVFVTTTDHNLSLPHPDVDLLFNNLQDFANHI